MHNQLLIVAAALAASGANALPAAPALPDPLVAVDGTRVASPDDWRRRREEIAKLLLDYEYGKMPPPPGNVRVENATATPALDGAATELRAVLALGPNHALRVPVGLFIPRNGKGPFPTVLALEPVWEDHLRPVARRMVDRGYIFAGFRHEAFDGDNADRSDGVHPLYPGYDWATLSAWAWGTMRVADYLLTLDAVDPGKLAVTGHSRWGKTALLAGALDERFALVVPHASGAGGAGCYRVSGPDCETLDILTDPKRFHYWFLPRLRDYAGREDSLPFDQHFLKALVAPRALLSVEGLGDLWANPVGTQLTWAAAQPVFDLLGAGDRNAIHFRLGGHDTTEGDWDTLLEFADHVFFGKPLGRQYYQPAFPDAPMPSGEPR